jgi:hypothetical protein
VDSLKQGGDNKRFSDGRDVLEVFRGDIKPHFCSLPKLVVRNPHVYDIIQWKCKRKILKDHGYFSLQKGFLWRLKVSLPLLNFALILVYELVY